uniref:Integrase catalytic domain-containing protein n=1 Tax=Parastrongyloides trichosuri TaxID=131310 RepID=A0A0N4Z1J4_PARTI
MLRNFGIKRIPPPEAVDQFKCPGQYYYMDLVGKKKPSSDNRDYYIVSVIDNFIRAVTLLSLKNYDYDSLVPMLHRRVFMIRQYPKIIKTNNGGDSLNEKFKKYLNNFNIRHITTCPNHTRGNSQCERSFKIEADIISKVFCKLLASWAETLESVQFYMNIMVCKTTQTIPFFIEHMREPDTALSQMLQTYIFNTSDCSAYAILSAQQDTFGVGGSSGTAVWTPDGTLDSNFEFLPVTSGKFMKVSAIGCGTCPVPLTSSSCLPNSLTMA